MKKHFSSFMANIGEIQTYKGFMDQEEESFITVKKIFVQFLKNRNDLEIPPEEIEETFQSLWIFIKKKNPQFLAPYTNSLNIHTAENFFNSHINENEQNKEYLEKLLISFKTDN